MYAARIAFGAALILATGGWAWSGAHPLKPSASRTFIDAETERLYRAAPLSRAKLLGSRIVSTALIALVVFAVIYAVAFAVFGVRVDGSAIGFVAVLIAFALLTASFGLLVAALGKTPEATRGLAILATLLLVMLGGAWVPSFIFPAWLQKISLFVPTRWAIDGLDAMTWRGLPLEAALLPVVVLLGFAAAFAVLAVARFQWEE